MKKKPLLHTTITFKWNGKPLKFDVVSNIHEYGLEIESAFINWSVRIEGKPSLLDFCNYVESKDYNFIYHPKYRREVSI